MSTNVNVSIEIILNELEIRLYVVHPLGVWLVADEASGFQIVDHDGQVNTDIQLFLNLDAALREWKNAVKRQVDLIHL
jgi:hypothetical protein